MILTNSLLSIFSKVTLFFLPSLSLFNDILVPLLAEGGWFVWLTGFTPELVQESNVNLATGLIKGVRPPANPSGLRKILLLWL